MELDVKRLYMPGTVVVATCPTCGKVCKTYLDDDYLSYPSTGVQAYGMVCVTHEPTYVLHEWDVQVDLQVRLVAVSGCEVRVDSDEDYDDVDP